MYTKTLVIRFGSLGDLILASAPTLNLSLASPQGHVVLFTKESFRPVGEMMAGVNEIVTIPDHCSVRQLYRTLHELDRFNFDTVIDLHGNFRSWFTRAFVVANRKATYSKRRWERWRVTLRKKNLPSTYPHTIDLYHRALQDLDLASPLSRPLLFPPELTEKSHSIFSNSSQTVVVAPGAAHPNKSWPVEKFAKAAVQLREQIGCQIIWAVGAGDRERQTAALALLPPDTVHLVACPIDQLAAIINASEVVIGNDSGIVHLASSVGTPAIAVFGPTHPVLGFAPRGLNDRVVQTDEPCRPCSRHGRTPCWRDVRYCFTGVETDRVVMVATELLELRRTATPAVFIDRDGTLIENKHYLADPNQVEFIDGAIEAVKVLRRSGYRVVLVSNQSGVARGYFSIADVERVNGRIIQQMTAAGAAPDAVYYCPHHPQSGKGSEYNRSCDCRKPSPGMAEQAALELNIDLRKSIVIGDSMVDVGLGRVIGGRTILVRTGYGREIADKHRQVLEHDGVMVCENLGEAVRVVMAPPGV